MKEQVLQHEVVLAGMESVMLNLHALLICRVEKVYPAQRRVDAKPVYLRMLRTEDEQLVTESLPVLQYVALGALRAGTARIEVPVNAGDWVCVFCFDDNIGKWLTAGGVDVTPDDLERHGLSGAVAMPWLFPDTQAPSEPLDQTNIVIGFDGGAKLALQGSGEVHLAGGADFVALAGKVNERIKALEDHYIAHQHTAPSGGGPTTPGPADPLTPGSSVAAEKTKAT